VSTEEVANARVESFPGGEFTAARETLGLSLEQLSRELRLPVRTLDAIEKGELKGLGGPVFVRGYIRTYAKRVKLDPNRYVALCDELLGVRDTASPVKVVGTVSTTPARQSHSLVRFGSIIFIIAIIGFVIWWWQTQYSIDSVLTSQADTPVTVDTADGNTLVLPAVDEEPVGSADLLPQPQPQSSEDAALLPEQSVLSASSASETESAGDETSPDAAVDAAQESVTEEAEAADVAEPTSEPQAPADAVADSLHLVLSEDSWLSVRDAGGRALFNGIAQAGSDLQLQGDAPLSVVIGRASAVTLIEYAGAPVDLNAVSDKNVARLTLPASER
jgi:cytoskeleton protein RodZ